MPVNVLVTGWPRCEYLDDFYSLFEEIFQDKNIDCICLRDVMHYKRLIIVHFDNGFDAMYVQEHLDGFQYSAANGQTYTLRCKITHNKCYDIDLSIMKIEKDDNVYREKKPKKKSNNDCNSQSLLNLKATLDKYLSLGPLDPKKEKKVMKLKKKLQKMKEKLNKELYMTKKQETNENDDNIKNNESHSDGTSYRLSSRPRSSVSSRSRSPCFTSISDDEMPSKKKRLTSPNLSATKSQSKHENINTEDTMPSFSHYNSTESICNKSAPTIIKSSNDDSAKVLSPVNIVKSHSGSPSEKIAHIDLNRIINKVLNTHSQTPYSHSKMNTNESTFSKKVEGVILIIMFEMDYYLQTLKVSLSDKDYEVSIKVFEECVRGRVNKNIMFMSMETNDIVKSYRLQHSKKSDEAVFKNIIEELKKKKVISVIENNNSDMLKKCDEIKLKHVFDFQEDVWDDVEEVLEGIPLEVFEDGSDSSDDTQDVKLPEPCDKTSNDNEDIKTDTFIHEKVDIFAS